MVDVTLNLEATRGGNVNGIQLNTYTQFAQGVRYTDPSEWLNPPLTLPAEEDIVVEAGDVLEVSLNYTLAGGLNAIGYSISNPTGEPSE